MFRKYILVSVLFIVCLFLPACDSSSPDELSHKVSDSESDSSNEIAMDMDEQATEEIESIQIDINQTERMIIHRAQLSINVKNIEQAQTNIEEKVNKYGGYIVESNIHRESENSVSSYMVVRIPEKHFQTFLSDTEEAAVDILERNVTGQDVTEEFVDLDSRLKSKRAVEERLLAFMNDAEKTEDLLKISNDLAIIQEEIEVIVGQMKYLENQTAFSTVDISMYEDSVIVPELGNKKLDTWEKTKKQLATSTNFLFAAISAVIVFVIGNLPVIIVLSVVSFTVYFIVKRKKTKNR